MPLNLLGRTKDAVFVLPADQDWRPGVARFLESVGGSAETVARHLDILDQRRSGKLNWAPRLSGRSLPNGRPFPPARAYAEMLVEERFLPLYEVDGLRFSLDLHNPGNEAAVQGYDPNWIEFAVVADIGAFESGVPEPRLGAGLSREEVLELRAARGRTLGAIVTRAVEATSATFAYADIGPTLWLFSDAGSVVHPAPTTVRPWDYLWSLTAWSPELLDDRRKQRLEALTITDEILTRVTETYRPFTKIHRQILETGGLFIQFRFLLGGELRDERAAMDTPLAKQAGLRSTRLQFRG